MKGWIQCFALIFCVAFGAPLFAQDLPSPDELTTPPKDEPVEEDTQTDEPTNDEAAVEPMEKPSDDGVSKSTTTSPKEDVASDRYAKRYTDDRYVKPKVNVEGTTGFQRIATTWGGTKGTYNVALMSEFFSANNAVRFDDQNTLFTGNLIFQANFFEFLSANLRLGTRNNVNSFGRPQAMLSQGDVLLNIKTGFELTQGFHLGGDVTVEVPTDFGSAGLGFAGTNVRPRLLTSLDFAELTQSNFQMHTHLNLGYRVDSTENLIPDNVAITRVERFAYNLSAYDAFEIGLGFAYDLPYVSPFLAWNLEAPLNPTGDICNDPNLPCVSDAGFGAWPNVLTVGTKAQFLDRLGAHIGVDIGLTSEDAAGLPVTAPYMIVGGLSWTIDPRPRVEVVEKPVEVETETAVKERILIGTVVDKETGEPVDEVIVRYPIGQETPQATSVEGKFRSYGFAPGSMLKLALSHPDYEPIEFETKLEDEEGEQEFSVQLVPLPKMASVLGLVEDEKGDPIPGATVKFTGPKNYTANGTSGGRFSQDITAGKYDLAVSADGYLTRGKEIEINPNDKLELQFVLKPEPKQKLVKLREDKIEIQQKIFFETGKANILPKSFNLLDQVTAVLAENPQIKKVQIEGHTDDVGADDFNMQLSQDRAESVRKYLIDQGLSLGRLEAKGFGKTRPILPNTSKRNRSLNRRVEFRIMAQ